ncbi:MerR family transcriptional regulator [Deinococcus maricopensis]|uniref:Regulatory protein MerR n=1 Tax=Deinococcus maricopensis (strain DSM 21211 / LMG 22137 / NRRL B-23946 / LB-34) TaxID=709986 RepID=E8U3U0_DEIML|nr:MerR family transcriptional regulator [Deinococcus maricopensis]ADV68783.1 regulatory protein MerR [Deinococcus maricopensis DSM 21211]
MSDAANVIVRTAAQVEQLTREFRERLRTDPAFAEVVAVLCGTPERLQVFTDAPGVSMAAFAALLGVPASTVRHYQRLGLITPYQVNGKFRFAFHNLVQAESVRQWRDLGLSLEDIQAQRAQERLGGQTATLNTLTTGRVSVFVTGKAVTVAPLQDAGSAPPLNALDPRAVWAPTPPEHLHVPLHGVFRDAPEPDWPLDVERLRAEVRAARLRLEERLRTLEAQLQRARALEDALSPTRP